MKAVTEMVRVDEQHVEDSLRQAMLQLDGESEFVLDFSLVRRIGPRALQELETLAELAEDKAVRIVLGGVNIDVYKAMKLLHLTRHFSFRNGDRAYE